MAIKKRSVKLGTTGDARWDGSVTYPSNKYLSADVKTVDSTATDAKAVASAQLLSTLKHAFQI
jgi:hypothetical protein